MNKLFENRVAMALVALALALLLFVFVKAERYNDNPVTFFKNVSENTTETVSNVPVHIKGNVDDYYITGLPDTVSVQLSGPANLIQQTLESEQLKVVTEDLSQLGEGQHYVRLEVGSLNSDLKASVQPSSVNITISTLESATFPVEAHVDQSQVPAGYALGAIRVKPERVTLQGSARVLEQVARVGVNVRLPEEASGTYEVDATVLITNSSGQILDVNADPQRVKVSVDVAPEENTVPIRLDPKNEDPNFSYHFELLSGKNATLKGPLERLNDIRALTVPIDVSGIEGEDTLTLPLPLPDGIREALPEEITVRVNATKKKKQQNQEEEKRSEPKDLDVDQPKKKDSKQKKAA